MNSIFFPIRYFFSELNTNSLVFISLDKCYAKVVFFDKVLYFLFSATGPQSFYFIKSFVVLDPEIRNVLKT